MRCMDCIGCISSDTGAAVLCYPWPSALWGMVLMLQRCTWGGAVLALRVLVVVPCRVLLGCACGDS
jgi:hypothetical protein